MAWNFSNPFSRPATPRPSPNLDASQSGTGQLAGGGHGAYGSGSFSAASINPHPHWFNHTIGNDGSHAPTRARFSGMGQYQAGHVGTGSSFNPYAGTYVGSSPMTGQVASG